MNNVVKERIVIVSSILLSIGIVLAALLMTAAVIIQSTVYSKSYYEKVTTAENYIPMLELAITNDLFAQSSYVAVPIEHLTAGLEDDRLRDTLDSHIQNVVDFLTYKADFTRATYPEDVFYKQLEIFIKADGVENEYTPSQEQYELLHEVAKDSSEIVMKHTNILNFNLIKNATAFKSIQRIVLSMRELLWPAAGLLVISLVLLMLIHRKELSRSVLFGASAFWIFGTLMLVPSIVLEMFGITRRLAIKTPYLKFAVDTWLTDVNHMAIMLGLVVFLCSTAVLITRILIRKKKPFKK